MLSCTILFSYVAMCSYIMFHFATRAFKLRSFFYVRARCCNIRIAHPRTWGRTSELNQVKCFFLVVPTILSLLKMTIIFIISNQQIQHKKAF